jgi:hypothetical protein
MFGLLNRPRRGRELDRFIGRRVGGCRLQRREVRIGGELLRRRRGGYLEKDGQWLRRAIRRALPNRALPHDGVSAIVNAVRAGGHAPGRHDGMLPRQDQRRWFRPPVADARKSWHAAVRWFGGGGRGSCR